MSLGCLFETTPPPPESTLFPYTTLFRSERYSGRAFHPNVFAGRGPRDLEFSARQLHFDGGIETAVTSADRDSGACAGRSEEHTSELQSHVNLVCRLLLETKKKPTTATLS